MVVDGLGTSVGSVVGKYVGSSTTKVGATVGAFVSVFVGAKLGAGDGGGTAICADSRHLAHVLGQAASALVLIPGVVLQCCNNLVIDLLIHLQFSSSWIARFSGLPTRALVSLHSVGASRKHVLGHITADSGNRYPSGGWQNFSMVASKLIIIWSASHAHVRLVPVLSTKVVVVRSAVEFQDGRIPA